MNDLISRRAAIEAIRNLYPDMPKIKFMDNVSNWHKQNEKYIECEKVISALPSAQPKKGKWVEDEYWDYKCSACGKGIDDEIYLFMPYCPNCGARMESEDGHLR